MQSNIETKVNINKKIKNMINKTDKISIIMPVHNCAKFIRCTINSVINQTYMNWEIIMVDDDSTDDTLKIIKDIIKNNEMLKNKIKIIKLNKNQGVSICRNIGLKEAKGEYIAYLDGDDRWNKEKLKRQYEFMKKNNIKFSYTRFEYDKKNSKKIVRIMPKSLNYKQSLKNTYILTSTVMINIKEIDKRLLKMPDIKRGQDTATWWQILKTGYIAYGLDENLTQYTIGTRKSLSSNKLTAIKRTWNLYRNVEKLNIIKSSYYFMFYAINAVMKRII